NKDVLRRDTTRRVFAMVHVERIDLSGRGIVLPSNRAGMVLAQPFLFLTDGEPFKCVAGAKETQLACVRKTLEIARQAPHHQPRTHFTILPEYSIPGLDGIAVVDNVLTQETWPRATVVIGGTDALTKSEYEQLLSGPNTHVDTAHNGADRVADNEWVNCAITW